MAMCTTSEITIRELDRRSTGGIDVRLLWNPRKNSVLVAVDDERSGDRFAFEVDGADALEAFQHPYAYAAPPRSPAEAVVVT
jgi:hypothetical protein